jgi:hypothetical protein
MVGGTPSCSAFAAASTGNRSASGGCAAQYLCKSWQSAAPQPIGDWFASVRVSAKKALRKQKKRKHRDTVEKLAELLVESL